MHSLARPSLALLAMLGGCVGAAAAARDQTGPHDASASAAEDDAGADPGGDWTPRGLVATTPFVCPNGPQAAFPAGLRIRELSLYQTVKIPLYQDGVWLAERVGPVVQHKPSLLRVFVDVLPGFAAHEVRGVLALQDGVGSTLLATPQAIGRSSTDAELGSTFDFVIAPELIGADTELTVWLEEPSCVPSTGTTRDARVPQVGTLPLGATEIAPLEVVIVPVRIAGRLPLVTDKELTTMKQTLLAHYPVPDVSLSVRAPLDWDHPLDPHGGETWSNLLHRIEQERSVASVPENVYYFALAQPDATSGAYCREDCTLGLAPQNAAALPEYQIALGVSFGDPQTYETLVHELGHAHGRAHAPCAPDGKIEHVDPNFPDPKAATGSWGWDSRNNLLMPPSTRDVMGYCSPTWMSAYTYAAIAARSAQVNRAGARHDKSARRLQEPWRRVLLYADQTARWGGLVAAPDAATQLERADVLDDAGQLVTQLDVLRTRLSDGADQFLSMPAPEASWTTLVLADRKLVLSTIAAPL